MLASSRNGNVCIRCAFRMRLRLLEQQRSRYATASQAKVDDEQAFRYANRPKNRIRYQNARDDPEAQRWAKREQARVGFAGGAGSEGIIRKFFEGAAENHRREFRTSDDRSKGRNREEAFKEALQQKLIKVKAEVEDAPVLEQVAKERAEWDGETKSQSFSRLWRQFSQKITQGSPNEKVPWGGTAPRGDQAIWNDLFHVFREKGPNSLEDRIKYHFYEQVTGSRFTASDIRNQKNMADLRYPSEWFPATRAVHRTIHLHVGPTNSGKTYHALQRLEQAETGVYAGPLRLLAHEVYARLNAKGRQCALVTGEEKRAPNDTPDATSFDMTACTVEMTPLNFYMDVAVIDEIQMIGNADRGWAWTQALLGVMAKEVHLCGEERTVPLIKEICASVGEKLEIHRYERLSPLAVSEKSLDGNLKKLRKGDCVISFSVMGIHALRKQIEKSTGRKVATVYGSLPPETRAQQARLFNDPNNDYDFLVASDAVGMGLNLAIKRIVFESSSKFNGYQRQTLSIADIKQIGGRAGRFRTAAQAAEAPASEADLAAAKGEPKPDQEMLDADDTPENVGLVTTLERFDFPVIRTAMGSEPEPIKSAGIFPPAPVLERFAGYFPPGTPFSYILARLHELSQMHPRFHLCGLKDQVWIADLIEGVEGLSIADKNILTSCPANKSDTDMWVKLMPAFARCIANQSGGDLTDIEDLPLEILEAEVVGSREYLRALEQLHKGVVVYLWLSYRFAGVFNTRALAFHVKRLVEDKIEKTLSSFSFSEAQRRSLAARREKQMLDSLMQATDETVAQHASQTEQPGSETAAATADVEEENEVRMEDFDKSQPEHEYNIDDIGSELEGRETQPPTTSDLATQTSQIAGGDHFAGEDMDLEEPDIEPEGLDKDAKTPSEEAKDEEQKPKEAASGSL
ncbi:ATP-dependent RNA helicase suv3, mitochondrial [Pseudocercospora fuligena]|uniref:RNA helicase n=1 Tax=Pseudocercospora fuligena TaxID=685502 RepID=A0A8H6R7U1_9PEZI|nr:ATP-dependent RNA helicase suv3, mitochondrial [Pseudocercospora fuligena]